MMPTEPALSNDQLDGIEQVSWLAFDAIRQLAEHFGLSVMQRHLVIHHLHHVSVKTAERIFSAEDKALAERARAEISIRAEETRAENLAADAAGVNTHGGSA
jgi:hypothetical protein